MHDFMKFLQHDVKLSLVKFIFQLNKNSLSLKSAFWHVCHRPIHTGSLQAASANETWWGVRASRPDEPRLLTFPLKFHWREQRDRITAEFSTCLWRQEVVTSRSVYFREPVTKRNMSCHAADTSSFRRTFCFFSQEGFNRFCDLMHWSVFYIGWMTSTSIHHPCLDKCSTLWLESALVTTSLV